MHAGPTDSVMGDVGEVADVPRYRDDPYAARKVGGFYQADGWVVAEFVTLAGHRRVVFEFLAMPGMLHIFNPDQIERVK